MSETTSAKTEVIEKGRNSGGLFSAHNLTTVLVISLIIGMGYQIFLLDKRIKVLEAEKDKTLAYIKKSMLSETTTNKNILMATIGNINKKIERTIVKENAIMEEHSRLNFFLSLMENATLFLHNETLSLTLGLERLNFTLHTKYQYLGKSIEKLGKRIDALSENQNNTKSSNE
jgi:hypothetical protein